MPTTTNYGWDIPADTDLVKDGALAMRTLGNSIDTTTKNLNPETTLGDLAYRSSTANVKTRLGIGTTGQVLTVSGGVPAWATPAAGGMTELATGTLSGSTINITSISGSYRDLRLVVRNYDPSGDGDSIRFNINNDTNSRYFDNTANSGTNQTFNRTLLESFNQDNGTSNAFLTIEFFDYANTTTWKTGRAYYVFQNATTPANADYAQKWWAYNQTAAITQINISAQNTFSGGTYILYGVS